MDYILTIKIQQHHSLQHFKKQQKVVSPSQLYRDRNNQLATLFADNPLHFKNKLQNAKVYVANHTTKR